MNQGLPSQDPQSSNLPLKNQMAIEAMDNLPTLQFIWEVDRKESQSGNSGQYYKSN